MATEDDKKAAQYRKEAKSGGTDAPVPPSVTQGVDDKKAAAKAAAAPTTKTEMGDSMMKFGLEMMKNSKPSNVESKAKGGKISSASSRGDGIAQRGKTKGTMVMCGGGMAKGKR